MAADLGSLLGHHARLQILSFQQDTTSGTAVTLIFMVIGICGYMCIPSISTWIVQTGGISSFNMP